jgi:hypothetical protein
MAKQRTDIMADDTFVVLYLIIVCTVGVFIGSSLA